MTFRDNDLDFAFCRNLFRRKGIDFTEAQNKVLDAWKKEMCVDESGRKLAFQNIISILQAREGELIALRKSTFQALLAWHSGKQDKDLKFCRDFGVERTAISTARSRSEWMSSRQGFLWLMLGTIARRCGPRLSTCWSSVKVSLTAERKNFWQLVLPGLKTDKDLRFCYNFLGRVFPNWMITGKILCGGFFLVHDSIVVVPDSQVHMSRWRIQVFWWQARWSGS